MRVGVIGGSGLYDFPGIENKREVRVATPFGDPSDMIVCGVVDGVETAFLARHGRGHVLLPSEINYRANIWALKSLGVERIVSVAAVGSLREDIAPGDVVLVDQFVDRTVRRDGGRTFFGGGIAAHVAFADPVCPELRRRMFGVAESVAARHRSPGNPHPRVWPTGTYLNMEGPAFSTRAESNLYRQWGMDVIGMTNMSEARLAREAEICYCTMAMVSDYDCWREGTEKVSVEVVLRIFRQNISLAVEIVREALRGLADPWKCECTHALQNAVITAPEYFPPDVYERLRPLLEKYFPAP